jgi:hypothetical protein
MALISSLKKVLDNSDLTAEESRAFETGLLTLSETEQHIFAEIVNEDPELIYPLYINYKAKLKAAYGTKEDWETAVQTEIVQLEDFLAKRKVGDEIM